LKHLLYLIFLIFPAYSFAGAWGVGSFENDSALGWVYELERAKSVNFLSSTFNKVQGGSYIDVDVCSAALAAAEIVASINNRSLANLPKEVQAWVKKYSVKATDQLKSSAVNAISRCEESSSSELARLWEESDKSEWSSFLSNLKSRLE